MGWLWSCVERPWKLGAKWTNKHIASDEKIETFELDYDGKRDRWNGYDASTYARVIERYEARKKYLKEQKLKKSEKSNQNDEDEEEENLMLDEAKVDESKQMEFAKVEKRVSTTGGRSTGTELNLFFFRNQLIREDTAKYPINAAVNSAHCDPKTRFTREDPLPDADPNEKFYGGDNQHRNSGVALEFNEIYIMLGKHLRKDKMFTCKQLHPKLNFHYKNFKTEKEKLKSQMKETIIEKYMAMQLMRTTLQENFCRVKAKCKLSMIMLVELLGAR
ncbi:hypothetical protein JHK82_053822 [Glycine max]|nr:hypothetical protein JHK86_053671 [Glycine max]KAG4928136.1 hypothetical protein JHK85_054622 [Glycine max]KAG5083658.1 hypothetical protein JHK84_053696 [Glycine max]KAG5086425.1 hypothetical protein JHK82_053822 [Glycine max]